MSANACRPQLRMAAKPGTYTNYLTGEPVDLTPEILAQAVAGSQALMAQGFNVRSFIDHEANDVLSVLADVQAIEVDDSGVVWTIMQPRDAKSEAAMEGMDVSVIIDENVEGADGFIAPLAITRIDTVPQAAIVGMPRPVKLARKSTPLFAGSAAPKKAEKPKMEDEKKAEPNMLMKALARGVGLAEGATAEEIQAHLLQANALLEASADEQMQGLANFMAKLSEQAPAAAPEKPTGAMADEPTADDAETAMADMMNVSDEEIAKLPAPMARMARTLKAQGATLNKLRAERLQNAVVGLAKTEAEAVIALARKIERKSGFELALTVAETQAAALKRAQPSTAFAGSRVAERPAAPARAADKAKDAEADKMSNLIALAAQRAGLKKLSKQA